MNAGQECAQVPLILGKRCPSARRGVIGPWDIIAAEQDDQAMFVTVRSYCIGSGEHIAGRVSTHPEVDERQIRSLGGCAKTNNLRHCIPLELGIGSQRKRKAGKRSEPNARFSRL